jgi:hypothetical protein
MKAYTLEVEINCPRERVLELFDDPESMAKWQDGFESFEPLSGEPGQEGATARITYLQGKRKIELIETVSRRKFPEEFHGRYSWQGGSNTLENYFLELGPERTLWRSTCDYEFSSLLLKLIGLLMPGSFKKQNLGFMMNFKALCEEGRDVREASKS